jgi:hypothetical protein
MFSVVHNPFRLLTPTLDELLKSFSIFVRTECLRVLSAVYWRLFSAAFRLKLIMLSIHYSTWRNHQKEQKKAEIKKSLPFLFQFQITVSASEENLSTKRC